MAFDPSTAARLVLLSGGAVFGLGALAWPTLRLWRRTGVFAITSLRSSDPVERGVGALLALLIAAYAVLLGAYGVGGPEAVGAATPGWPAVVLGAGALFSGIAVVMIAQAHMGRSWRIGIDTQPTALVTTGLYRWVRSPIYGGILLALAGVAVIVGTLLGALGLPLVGAAVSWQARREEAHMARQHPEEFAAWKARTGRFFPWIG